MTSRRRILYLSPCLPTERTYGTPLRVQQVASALSAIGQLDLVVLKWGGVDPVPNPGRGGAFSVRRVIDIHNRPPTEWRDRLRCSLDTRFLGYHGQTIAPEDRDFVLNELANYDLVWLHQIRTADLFGRWHWPCSVMDLDDVPSTYLGTLLQQAGVSAERRLRTRVQRRIARRREHILPERFTAVSVCSEADRRYLGLADVVHVVPNGFARPERAPERQPVTPPRVGFIGTLDYPPNVEGVEWFVRECWPQIQRQAPGVRMRMIGKSTDRLFAAGVDGVDALGWVESPTSEIATWSMMVVPVRIGAGTRVKIADGFSRKCPIVSTQLGAFGYDVEDGRELILADSAEGFVDACLRLLRERGEAERMAERAWVRFLEHWTWEALEPKVHAAAEFALRGGVHPATGLRTTASHAVGEAAE
jgi:glycosyltransferase involved in cell wall biosynthesis